MAKAGNRFIIGPLLRRFPLTELRERERQERQQRRWLQQMLDREMLKRSLANPSSSPLVEALPKKRQYLKWQQEETLRRVRQKYPDGDIPRTAEVRRAISDRKFQPSYNTVHATLGRKRPKK